MTLLYDQVELATLLNRVRGDDDVAAGPIFVVEAPPPVALLRHCCLMRVSEGHVGLY
ncbi:hypothetical protein D3C76_1273310 [compost metagenome]